jgi:hypothetical protein
MASDYYVDDNGDYLIDGDGNYLLVQAGGDCCCDRGAGFETCSELISHICETYTGIRGQYAGEWGDNNCECPDISGYDQNIPFSDTGADYCRGEVLDHNTGLLNCPNFEPNPGHTDLFAGVNCDGGNLGGQFQIWIQDNEDSGNRVYYRRGSWRKEFPDPSTFNPSITHILTGSGGVSSGGNPCADFPVPTALDVFATLY